MPTTQEILRYLEDFITPERKEKIADVLSRRTRHFTVVVEDVYQMHNASAVMRSCEIFGIQDVHAISMRNPLKTDSEIAMGAQKWVDLYHYSDNMQCINELKSKGYQIIATTPHEKDNLLHDFDISQKAAFVFGTEKKGVSQDIMDNADGFLKIPMYGFTESLNISVSASIIIQSVMQRLHASTFDWHLSEEEILEKKLDWTKKSTRSVEEILERYFEEYQR